MRNIQVTEYSVPAPVPLIRFAVVTDLHNRNAREVADTVSGLAPDACLLVGDLFEGPPRRRKFSFEEVALCLELLAPLCPLFWVPGNHDVTLPPALREIMDGLGVHRLENRWEPFCGVLLGGLSSAEFEPGRIPDTAFLRLFSQEAGYKILLSHHPEYYPKWIRPLPIDLTVSGHAHGGQWCIFGRGIYAPGQGLFPRYTAGLSEGRLLVSRGLKRSLIPRFGNPREVLLLTVGNGQHNSKSP